MKAWGKHLSAPGKAWEIGKRLNKSRKLFIGAREIADPVGKCADSRNRVLDTGTVGLLPDMSSIPRPASTTSGQDITIRPRGASSPRTPSCSSMTDSRALNRYAYCGDNPLSYTDPTGHIFGLDDLIELAIAIYSWVTSTAVGAITAGAALGASMSAITGGNPLTGAIAGAITGGLFYGAGSLIQTLPGVTEAGLITTNQALIEASLIHLGAGAASGAISAALGGGNVGMAALTAGLSAGAAEGFGGSIEDTQWFQHLAPVTQFAAGLGSEAGIGAVTGGISSEMVDGHFIQGMGQGAWTAAYGFVFNFSWHTLFGNASDAGPGCILNGRRRKLLRRCDWRCGWGIGRIRIRGSGGFRRGTCPGQSGRFGRGSHVPEYPLQASLNTMKFWTPAPPGPIWKSATSDQHGYWSILSLISRVPDERRMMKNENDFQSAGAIRFSRAPQFVNSKRAYRISIDEEVCFRDQEAGESDPYLGFTGLSHSERPDRLG